MALLFLTIQIGLPRSKQASHDHTRQGGNEGHEFHNSSAFIEEKIGHEEDITGIRIVDDRIHRQACPAEPHVPGIRRPEPITSFITILINGIEKKIFTNCKKI